MKIDILGKVILLVEIVVLVKIVIFGMKYIYIYLPNQLPTFFFYLPRRVFFGARVSGLHLLPQHFNLGSVCMCEWGMQYLYGMTGPDFGISKIG